MVTMSQMPGATIPIVDEHPANLAPMASLPGLHGHGFGLHSRVPAARSGGSGHGATATLELPLHPSTKAA
jgi:hypothetical protein